MLTMILPNPLLTLLQIRAKAITIVVTMVMTMMIRVVPMVMMTMLTMMAMTMMAMTMMTMTMMTMTMMATVVRFCVVSYSCGCICIRLCIWCCSAFLWSLSSLRKKSENAKRV